MVRKGLFIILLGLTLYGGGRLYFRLTDGFSVTNITSEFAFREGWSHPAVSQEAEQVARKVLKQRFNYLDRGAQSYAFVSEDGQYVLKIIKQKHLKMQIWDRALSLLPFTEGLYTAKRERQKKRTENVLRSHKISYEELKEETGLVYLHLNHTDHLKQPICFTDKMGLFHRMESDDLEFVIQKKAVLSLDYLAACIQNSERGKLRQALDDLIDFRVDLCRRGIKDQDVGFTRNMGYLNEKPMMIDTGQFIKDPSIAKLEVYRADLKKKNATLLKWLQQRSPEDAQYLEERLALL